MSGTGEVCYAFWSEHYWGDYYVVCQPDGEHEWTTEAHEVTCQDCLDWLKTHTGYTTDF